MIPIIGWIVGVYCMARLLQVPIESPRVGRASQVALWLISFCGIAVIGLLCVMLLFRGLDTGTSINSIVR